MLLLARASAADEPVIALPPFLVEEAAKGPPWRYATLPGYEILARCPDRSTKDVVEAHFRLHQLLAELLPERFQVKMTVPKALILYDEALQPAASQEVIARIIRGNPAPPVIERSGSLGRDFRTSLPLPRVAFLPNLRLWDHDAMTVFMIVRRDGFDPDRLALTPHYVTYLVRSRLPTLPHWFVAGFLSLYDDAIFDRGELRLPYFTGMAVPTADAPNKTSPALLTRLSLADVFEGRLAPGEAVAPPDAVARWRAQAALFVRWGVDGRGAPRRQALWTFAERCAVELVTEELFRECFGMDFAAASAQLAAYLPTAARNTVRFRAPGGSMPPLLLRNATDAQIARIKGDWERMEVAYVKAISPELAPKYLEQARRTLTRAFERDVRDPEMLAVMGLCEVDAGNDAGALPYLESAARIGKLRPRAAYELGRLRLAALRAARTQGDEGWSAAQTATVLTPLFAARREDPPLAEVYELIAETWAGSAASPTRAHLAVLDEGVRIFPRRSLLVQRAAELNLRHGFRAEAAALAKLGVKGATDDAIRANFAELQRRVEEK